jgi:hypothetical protein
MARSRRTDRSRAKVEVGNHLVASPNMFRMLNGRCIVANKQDGVEQHHLNDNLKEGFRRRSCEQE